MSQLDLGWMLYDSTQGVGDDGRPWMQLRIKQTGEPLQYGFVVVIDLLTGTCHYYSQHYHVEGLDFALNHLPY